jgi:hypothetical protein
MKFSQIRRLFLYQTAGLAALFASALAVNAAVFEVNVDPITVYTDPCNGNQIKAGGFSGLYPVPGHPFKFYVVSDRGPGPDFIDAEGKEYKIFPVPDFGPQIMAVQWNLRQRRFEIVRMTPLTKPDGTTVTGLPNDPPPASGEGYDLNLRALPHDNDSIDAEGLTMDPWGHFWLCEEYLPSIAMAAANGRVLLRLVPEGTLMNPDGTLKETVIPTYDVLPGILAKRRSNRGLEGIAVARNGRLYSIMQRPLSNPKKADGDVSQNIRLLEVDLGDVLKGNHKPLVRQLLYRTEPNPTQSGVYASDLFSVTPSLLLVPERVTDKLFVINIARATDITPFETADGYIKPEYLEDPAAKVTIEQLDEAGLAALGIKTVKKTVVLDSMIALEPGLEKCEGVCMVGGLLVLTYDNDFNLDVASLAECSGQTEPLLQINLFYPPKLPKITMVPWPARCAFGDD